MVKKIIRLGVALIICLGLFSACNSGLWFKVGYEGQGGFGSKEIDEGETYNLLAFVNSVQELKDLCSEWNNPAFQEESEFYSSEINKKIREYDGAFFEEKALIIRSSFDASPGRTPRIKSINVKGVQLIVDMCYDTKKGTFEDVAFTWLSLIEVKKADIVRVTEIKVKQ